MSEAAPDPEALESRFAEGIRERLEQQKPSAERRRELRLEHKHHLVRDTTSQLQLDDEIDLEGVYAEAKATIPDTYCFTCGQWIGLSGADLRGKPRSKADAYYLAGPPDQIVRAREKVRDGLAELVAVAYDSLDTCESIEDAEAFVSEELERTSFVFNAGDGEAT